MDMPLPPLHTLIVCPATMKNVWLNEIRKWRPQLKDFTIISYEMFAKQINQFAHHPPHTVVFDESHYLKTPDAKRTKAAVRLAQLTPRVRLLSGTPVVNRPIEIHAMLKAIGGTKLDWKTFAYKYCAAWHTPWDTFDVSGASNTEELYERLEPVMFRMTKQTALPELPAKTYRVVEFDMNITRRELQFKKDMIEKGATSVPFQAISDIMRMNGSLKVPHVVNYVLDSLSGNEDPHSKIVIFCWHQEVADLLAQKLSQQGVLLLTGKTSVNSRSAIIHAFQTNPKFRVFIGNIKAAGVGITLTAASHVIFAETTWVPGELHQAADRCHRIGQKNHVQVDILTVRKSIDAMMLHSMLDKQDVINQIIKENPMTDRILDQINHLLDDLETARDMLDNIHDIRRFVDELAKAQTSAPQPITREELRIAVAELITRYENIKTLQQMLITYHCAKLSDLPQDRYAAFHADLLKAYSEI